MERGERATLLGSKDYLTITWDAVPGATGYRIACDWSAGERFGYNSWRKCGKDGSAWKVHGTSAGTNRRDRPLPRRPQGRQQHRPLVGR